MAGIPIDPPNPYPLRTKPEFNDELVSCMDKVARDDDGAAARRIAELLELDGREPEAETWWRIASSLGDRDAIAYLDEIISVRAHVRSGFLAQAATADAEAVAKVLIRLSNRAVGWVGAAESGSVEQTAAGAVAMQLNQYAFWIRRGWVNPVAVTGVLLAGRQPGMTLPGDEGYPFPLAPGAGGRR